MRSFEFLRFMTVFVGVTAAFFVARSASADDASTVVAPPKLGFKGFADLEDAVTIATGVSPDKQAMTVLFRNLEATVAPIKSGPLVDTRTLTVLLPLEKQDKDIGLTIDIRGFAELHNSTGTLIVQAPGQLAQIIPIADAQREASSDVKKKLKAGPRRERDKSNGGGDFNSRINGRVKPGALAKITFVLIVERDFANTSADGLIEIDSLDVSISQVQMDPPAPPVENAPRPAS